MWRPVDVKVYQNLPRCIRWVHNALVKSSYVICDEKRTSYTFRSVVARFSSLGSDEPTVSIYIISTATTSTQTHLLSNFCCNDLQLYSKVADAKLTWTQAKIFIIRLPVYIVYNILWEPENVCLYVGSERATSHLNTEIITRGNSAAVVPACSWRHCWRLGRRRLSVWAIDLSQVKSTKRCN